jgi:hypothetical protein
MNRYTEKLNLFGLIKYKKAIKIDENFENYFDKCYYKGTNIEISSEKATCYIGALENDLEFTEKLINMGVLKIFDQIFGEENYYFWGSDLTPFKSGSNYHRDSFTELPQYKMGIYLENSYGEDQKFIFLPGSHKFNDKYSKELSKGLNWPNGAGITENIFSNRINNGEFIENFVPAQYEQIERGDVLIFDNRLIHAVAGSNKQRRLIAISVIPKYELAKTINPFFSNYELYRTYVLLLRISAQAVETKYGKKTRYGQKNLEIEKSEFYNKLAFKDYSDNDFEQLANLVFKENTNPLNFINQS